ncbi:hypothetical protein D3C73_1030850 [compost metagenome]
MFLQRAGKHLQVRPSVRVRYADGLHLMGLQHRVVVEIARVVDQHAVAGLQQEAADQVDRMRPRFGQQQLLHRRFDAQRGRASLQRLPQCRQAEWPRVVDQVCGVGAGHAAQATAQAIVVQPVTGHPAAAGLEVAGRGFQ